MTNAEQESTGRDAIWRIDRPMSFVRRSRHPVDEVNPKVLIRWSEHFHREHVLPLRVQKGRGLQFEDPVCARDLAGIREFLPIQPDVGVGFDSVVATGEQPPRPILRPGSWPRTKTTFTQ